VRGDVVARSQRLALTIVGLVGLTGCYIYAFARDVQLIKGLQDAVVAGPVTIFWVLRIGLRLLGGGLACVALVQTIRGRPLRGRCIAVLVVLLGPVVHRGLPLRLTVLPHYLFFALYLVPALSAHDPRSEI